MIEAVARPPPENRSSSPSSWLVLNRLASWVWFTFGTGTLVRARKTSRIPSVNRILRRMSGARNAWTRDSITSGLAVALARLGRFGLGLHGGLLLRRLLGGGLHGLYGLWRRTRLEIDRGAVRPADQLRRAAGGGELGQRGSREGVGVDRHSARRIASAQDLDRHRPRLLVAEQHVVTKHVGGDQGPRGGIGQAPQVQGGVLDPEPVLEAVQLGRADVKRRLAALEPGGDAASGSGLLALRAAPGGLAPARAVPAPNTARGLVRPPARLRMVELHLPIPIPGRLCRGALLDRHQEGDAPQHAASNRRVGDLDAGLHPMQAKRAYGAARSCLVPDGRLHPGDAKRQLGAGGPALTGHG